MRNILAFVLLITSTVLFADEPFKQYLGKWNYTDYLVSLRPEKKELVDRYFKDFYLQFNEDTTFSGKIMGEEETGTWVLAESGDAITLTDAEGNVVKVSIISREKDEMTIDMGYGEFLMTREKKKEK